MFTDNEFFVKTAAAEADGGLDEEDDIDGDEKLKDGEELEEELEETDKTDSNY